MCGGYEVSGCIGRPGLVCDQIRWRTAALVYLRGTVPPEHYMWQLRPRWQDFSVPASYPDIA